jgi:uncharacterized protein
MTQPSGAVAVEFDVPATMRDGTVLRANVYRPTGDGPWPVLLTRLPYSKDLPGALSMLDPVQAARRGYMVVIQDTRGRFRSEGEWEPMLREREDGFDTVAWAAALPSANGQVGMYGGSYFGFTQWAAAGQQPPALRAIVPTITWDDPLRGLAYRGGALELGTMANWHLLQGFDVLARRHRADPRALAMAVAGLADEIDRLGPEGYASLPLAEFAPLRRQPVAPAFFETVAHAMDRAATEPVVVAHDRVQVPSLNIGGWNDIFLAGTIANYQAMRQRGLPTKLLIGPWVHSLRQTPVGEVNFGFRSQITFIDLKYDLGGLQLRWFDHWLKGLDTGMLREAPISLFVMGANRWRDEQEWPLARAVDAPYYLHANGGLSIAAPAADEAPDRYTYDPADPVPTLGGSLLMTPEYPGGPIDQRPIEARPDVLVYTTPPLARDTEVTGPVRLRLWAASSAPDTDFVGRLVDVHPDGRSLNLADGIVRARYRCFDAGEPPSLLEPGRPYPLEIDLWATSNVFKAGHRIGLQVTSSSFPRWDRNPNTGHAFGADAELRPAQQTILHDAQHPSQLVLPIVP